MLVVLPVCASDLHLALKNLAVCRKFDDRVAHTALISHPTNCDVSALRKACEAYFSEVATFSYSDWAGPKDWPQPQNWAFQETARHLCANGSDCHWFWWEADAVPLKSGWLDALEDAHTHGGHPFSGHIVQGMGHMNGVAIYPPKLNRFARRAFLIRTHAFDIVLSEEVGVKSVTNLNHLIGHRLKANRRGTTFANEEDVQSMTASGIVLFHGCSDGTLQNLILGGATGEPVGLIQCLMRLKYGKGKWTVAKEAARKVVNLLVRVPEPRLIHCLERHKQKDEDSERRVMQAQESWIALYKTKRVIPAHIWHYQRDSHAIGDPRGLPYLKDVLLAGLNAGKPDDFVMWTNDDTILHAGVPDVVIPETAKKGAVSSFRVNFDKGGIPDLAASVSSILAASRALKPPGDIDLGRDLFCFTKPWLREHWHEIPDFLLGELEFDLVLAFMIRKHNSIQTTKLNWDQRMDACELPKGYVMHERHHRVWTSRAQESSAGKQYNRRLATEWYADNGLHSLITSKI